MPIRFGTERLGWAGLLTGAVVGLFLLATPGLPTGAPLPGPASPPSAGDGSCPLGPCALPQAASVPLAAGDTWFNVTSTQLYSMGPVVGASLAYDAVDNYLVLFGGCTPAHCPAPASTWKYAGGLWTNITAASGAQPPARAYASMAFDSRDGYVLLFGGLGAGGSSLNDSWTFTGGAWHNVTNVSSAPPARYAASMAYDHVDNFVVLFGGCGAIVCPRADTWQFLNGGWKNVTALAGTAPPARYGAAFTYDAGDGVGVLFGGCGGACPLGDTWEFSKGHWVAQAPTVAPPARAFGTLTYASVENVTYLFGGNGSAGALNDSWRFSAGRWTLVSASLGAAPHARFGQAALASTEVWMTAGVKRLPYVLVLGGSNGSCPTCADHLLSDTWILEPVQSVVASVLPSVVEVGQPAAFSATAAGGSPPYVYLWTFGDAGSSAVGAPTHSYAAPGSYIANVTATDQAGVWDTFPVGVTVIAGPGVRLAIQPTVTDVGLSVAFTGTVSGGTAPYATTWTFGDLTSATSLSAYHAYGAPGNYSVQLHGADAVQGYGDAFGQVTVHALPSVDAIASSTTPNVGQRVSFSATESGGTGPFAFHWSFGDGGSANGSQANYTFARSGSFRASVTVVDVVGGSSSYDFSLVVAAAPGGGGSPLGPLPTALLVGLIAVVAIVCLVAVLFLRRRRRHPPSSLAAAPAEQTAWGVESSEPPAKSKRAIRRDVDRFYRRRT